MEYIYAQLKNNNCDYLNNQIYVYKYCCDYDVVL